MEDKKLVSYCLFAYNQEKYIKEAVLGALSQTYTPLEIIISDDFSTDKTFAIIEELARSYKGPHRIIINKNKKNLGVGAHFSRVCCGISTGEYIVVAAGDDVSFDNHVEYAVDSIERFNEVAMIDFNADIIDENGKITNINSIGFDYKKYSINDYLNVNIIQHFAPGRIIKRELFDLFNPISNNCHTEDSVLVLRSLLMNGFMRINKKLLYYRKHDSNLSNQSSLALISSNAIICQYLNDLICFCNFDKFDEMMFDDMFKRIILERQLRKYKFSLKVNYFQEKYASFIIKLLIIKYLFYKKSKIYFEYIFNNT